MSTQIMGADLAVTTSDPKFALRTKVKVGTTEYLYIKAGTSALTAYNFCYTDQLGATGAATTTAVGAFPLDICVPQVDFPANYYGWAAIAGDFTAFVGASCVAGAKLNTTATAGLADDASTTVIAGAIVKATVGGSNANSACFAFKPMSVNQ